MGQLKRHNRKTSEVAARRQRVSDLFAQKLTITEIANELNVSVGTISNDIGVLRQLWQEAAADSIDNMMWRELADLEEMERKAAAQYEKKPSTFWIDTRLKIKERRAKLTGLDAPIRRELTGKDGAALQIEAKNSNEVDIINFTPEQRAKRIIALLETARSRKEFIERTGVSLEQAQEMIKPPPLDAA